MLLDFRKFDQKALISSFSVDTVRKLNVHKTFRTSSELLMYIQFSSCFYGVYSLKKSEKTKLVAQNEFQMYFEERIWWKFSGKFLRLGKLQVHKLQFEIKMDCTLDVFLTNLQNGKWDLQKSCFFLNIAEKSRKWDCLYSFCSEGTVVSEIWNKKICSSKI